MISIVVPVYKSEKTLGGCLESLMAQSYQDIEIICVVDGSPDQCGDICDAYGKKDSRIRVIKRENGGVSSARNRGIEESVGDFLMFVDSDDTVEPDYCETMWKAQKETGADMVICGFHHWFIGRDIEKSPAGTGVYDTKNYAEDFLKLYQAGFLNMPWNKLFKKELAGRFDTSLSLGEDLLFNMDYLEKCEKVTVIYDALYHYIQEEKGNTLSSKKREDKLEIASRVCKTVQSYYGKLTGKTGLHPVIAGKFVMEFLDDCERLPFDRTMPKKEKLQMIRSLAKNQEFVRAAQTAQVTQLDYYVLQMCFAYKMWRLVYPVCVMRKGIVMIARCLWNR